MFDRDTLANMFFRLGTEKGPDRPLGPLERKYLWSLPLAILVTLVGTLLEGFSIGLLIPLLNTMLAGASDQHLVWPLLYVEQLAERLSPGDPLLAIGGMMLGLVILKNAIGVTAGLAMTQIDGLAGADLRAMLARRLLRLPYTFFMIEEPPQLINVISSDSWRASEAIQAIYGIASAMAAATVLSLLAIWANWKLFLIVFAGGLVARFLQQYYSRRVKLFSEQVSEANRHLGERMMLIVDLARLIRVFNQEGEEQKRFEETSENVRKAMYDVERASAWYSPLIELLLASLFIVVLLLSRHMDMTVPEILAFLVLQYRLQPHVMAINQGILDLAGLSGSVKEVEWLLGDQEKPEPQGGQPLLDPIDRPIVFENVSYVYPYEEQPVLREASFTIPNGSATALIGRSGAGKSTLVNVLLRLMDPTSGRIMVGDMPLSSIDPGDWRSRIALAGQDVDLIEGTVADNIAYRREGLTPADIEEAARVADAHDFIVAMGGYGATIGSYGSNLSGGQRQRISLARALVRKPDLLILDEATNAVDGISENVIMQLLREHRAFQTAIVISHRRSTLSACQQGIVIDAGRIVEAGPLRSLDFYREMERWPDSDVLEIG